MSSPIRSALALFDEGFKVFPLLPNTKVPAVKDWANWAVTATRGTIETYGDPEANWGLVPSLSGHMVLDLDIKGEVDGRSALATNPRLPDTFQVRTPSGGIHYYFLGTCRPSRSKVGVGLDLRSEDSYVVAPGSIIDDKEYWIEENHSIKECPAWLMGKAVAVSAPRPIDRPAATELDTEENLALAVAYLKAAPICEEGSGEFGGEYLYTVFCEVRDRGISEDMASELVQAHYNSRCDPPWELSDDADKEHFEAKLANAYKYAQNPHGVKTPEAAKVSAIADFAAEPLPPEVVKKIEEKQKAFKEVLPLKRASTIDGPAIKPRQWIVRSMLLKHFVSVTAAPGGTGKSNLEILKAISIVTGKNLLGDRYLVDLQGPVILFNGEDPLDEMERRVEAFRIHLKLPREALYHLHLVSGQDHEMTLATLNDQGIAIPNEKDISRLIATAQSVGAAALSCDPLVSMHAVRENTNVDMEMVVRAFKRIAKNADCGISLVHHTNKGAQRAGEDSDPASHLRGASSLVNGARVAHILKTMTGEEAKRCAIPETRRRWYFKVELAKANLSAPAEYADWFQSGEATIPNGEKIGICAYTFVHAVKEMQEAEKKATASEKVQKKSAAILDLCGQLIAHKERLPLKDFRDVARKQGFPWAGKNSNRMNKDIAKALEGQTEFILEKGGKGKCDFICRNKNLSDTETLE